MNFEIYLNFFYLNVFPHDQKSQDKNLNILRTKRPFKMRLAFFIIFKELPLKQIKQTYLDGESSALNVDFYL